MFNIPPNTKNKQLLPKRNFIKMTTATEYDEMALSEHIEEFSQRIVFLCNDISGCNSFFVLLMLKKL